MGTEAEGQPIRHRRQGELQLVQPQLHRRIPLQYQVTLLPLETHRAIHLLSHIHVPLTTHLQGVAAGSHRPGGRVKVHPHQHPGDTAAGHQMAGLPAGFFETVTATKAPAQFGQTEPNDIGGQQQRRRRLQRKRVVAAHRQAVQPPLPARSVGKGPRETQHSRCLGRTEDFQTHRVGRPGTLENKTGPLQHGLHILPLAQPGQAERHRNRPVAPLGQTAAAVHPVDADAGHTELFAQQFKFTRWLSGTAAQHPVGLDAPAQAVAQGRQSRCVQMQVEGIAGLAVAPFGRQPVAGQIEGQIDIDETRAIESQISLAGQSLALQRAWCQRELQLAGELRRALAGRAETSAEIRGRRCRDEGAGIEMVQDAVRLKAAIAIQRELARSLQAGGPGGGQHFIDGDDAGSVTGLQAQGQLRVAQIGRKGLGVGVGLRADLAVDAGGDGTPVQPFGVQPDDTQLGIDLAETRGFRARLGPPVDLAGSAPLARHAQVYVRRHQFAPCPAQAGSQGFERQRATVVAAGLVIDDVQRTADDPVGHGQWLTGTCRLAGRRHQIGVDVEPGAGRRSVEAARVHVTYRELCRTQRQHREGRGNDAGITVHAGATGLGKETQVFQITGGTRLHLVGFTGLTRRQAGPGVEGKRPLTVDFTLGGQLAEGPNELEAAQAMMATIGIQRPGEGRELHVRRRRLRIHQLADQQTIQLKVVDAHCAGQHEAGRQRGRFGARQRCDGHFRCAQRRDFEGAAHQGAGAPVDEQIEDVHVQRRGAHVQGADLELAQQVALGPLDGDGATAEPCGQFHHRPQAGVGDPQPADHQHHNGKQRDDAGQRATQPAPRPTLTQAAWPGRRSLLGRALGPCCSRGVRRLAH